MKRRALFLDRDGVINVDHGYVIRQEDFQFVEGVLELGRQARKLGYLIIVVTNQAGIGRGYYGEKEFLALSDWMCGTFKQEGAPIDKVYFCPTHPEYGVGEYKVESFFRKPNPGMIVQAAEEFDIDLGQSLLVGDKESDIAAGRAAGIRTTILYSPLTEFAVDTTAADCVVASLGQVIPLLVAA